MLSAAIAELLNALAIANTSKCLKWNNFAVTCNSKYCLYHQPCLESFQGEERWAEGDTPFGD